MARKTYTGEGEGIRYKKIIEDRELTSAIVEIGIANVADESDFSRKYLYAAIAGKYTLIESTYCHLKAVVKKIREKQRAE